MRDPSVHPVRLTAVAAALAALATGLPGLGLVLWSPAMLGVLGLGTLVLVLVRDRDFGVPMLFLSRLLGMAAAVAVGLAAGRFGGTLAQDWIFWHYAPALEGVVQRMAAEGRTGPIPTADLPLAARFCCRSAPAVYRDHEGADPSMVTGYFEVADDYQYHYQPPAGAPGRTDYYGAASAGSVVPLSSQGDVGFGECDPIGPRAHWCLVRREPSR